MVEQRSFKPKVSGSIPDVVICIKIFIYLITMYTFIFSDIPRSSQLFFQDTATPMMSGIIDLHQHVCFFIIIIFVIVITQMFNILIFFRITNFKKNLRNLITLQS